MIASTSGVPPAPEELDALLRLLDDDTPEVRIRVAERLALYGGDISEWLATRTRPLSPAERSVLTELLGQTRRRTLEREWLVPSQGANALSEDWEAFEAILRTISDFLHDGITLRQPLSDALDLLAEEAETRSVTSARELAALLFQSGRLTGNRDHYEDPRNSDLAWSIAEGKSNPLGLCVIFTLVAQRMNLVVEPVNFPGHFLTRIHEDGVPLIVDCFDHGRLHLQDELLENPDLRRTDKRILRQTAGPGTVLMRLLNNLGDALQIAGRGEDAGLIRKLRATLG